MKTELQWQFGGWLQTLSPALAASVLAIAACAGLALIVILYGQTLRLLPPWVRRVLTTLRVLILLTLLLFLANPTRVQRDEHAPDKAAPQLAIVVDRSASMSVADNRHETRLSNALRQWKAHTDEAHDAFPNVDFYRFSSQLEKTATLDEAAQSGAAGPETQLWSALQHVINDAPTGVVCLTDGLDTTGVDAQAVVAAAQQRGVPLYFVAGQNRSRVVELLSIRDVKTPAQVLRQSKFTVSTLLEISTPRDREVPIELWSGDRQLGAANLAVRAGWNTLPWSQEITAAEAGPMPLEFRLGSGAAQEIAASTTQVVDHTKLDILYYQGALQWGSNFLRNALESDPSFRVSSILNPALHVRMVSGATSGGLFDLPETAEGLQRFQVIVLAHVFADQLSPAQQTALVDYAKAGGGVLFIAPDSEATKRFAGTQLEGMLPIVFDGSPRPAAEAASENFENQMRSVFNGDSDSAGILDASNQQALPTLVPFTIPKGAPSILPRGQPLPLFSNYARASRAKAGAEVLAVHPSERTSDQTPRVLLARQQFGRGFTAALTTDLLWRWKMSLPSGSRAVETFWQQLLLSLAPATGDGLRLLKTTGTAAVGQTATFLAPSTDHQAPPQITALSPTGESRALLVAASPEGWQAVLTPEVAGRWQLSATDAAGGHARITVQVTPEVRTQETSNAPADLEGMRRIAEATGGALIDENPLFHQDAATLSAAPEISLAQPLWNQSWLLALLLALYATELLIRRSYRLL